MLKTDSELFRRRVALCKLWLRIIELILCLLCLGLFIALICLFPIPLYVTIPILIIAALTTLLVLASLTDLILARKQKEKLHKIWIYFILASMISYFVCIGLIVVAYIANNSWLPFLALFMACAAAFVFIIDFVLTIWDKVLCCEHISQRNQIAPEENSVAYHKNEENKVAYHKSEEKIKAHNAVSGVIECSIIVGDQLACNQQLCHVKWSENQASSTPTAKLIYVQPCSSTVANKICPACKNFNCKKCFHKDKSEPEALSAEKSTQFPEDNEKVCPLCTFKAIKLYKTAYVQTSDEYNPNPKPENITRSVHSAKINERPSYAQNKLIQSSPVTPRKKTLEQIMNCPHCHRRSSFLAKKLKKHACPLCNQQCTNKLTCTRCHYTINQPPTPPPEEIIEKRKSTGIQTEVSRRSRSKSPSFFIKQSKDKVTQVSSKEFLVKTPEHTRLACKKEQSYIELRETETQVSLTEFIPMPQQRSLGRPGEYKATNVSSRELLQEMEALIDHKSTEKIFVNKAFGDRSSEINESINESTQVSHRGYSLQQEDFPLKESKFTQVAFPEERGKLEEDKLTQVSSSDFVQKERGPCGAPNCQHPTCAKYKTNIIQVMPQEKQTVDELIQTEEIKKVCNKNVAAEPKEPKITEISCQTTKSLEEMLAEIVEEERKDEEVEVLLLDPSVCIDPKCSCVISDKEIQVCTYCQNFLNQSKLERQLGQIEIPSKSGCVCNLPDCICCKAAPETKEVEKRKRSPSPDYANKCFCVKTEKGLLMCNFCEAIEESKKHLNKSGINDEDIMEPMICSSSVSTCLYYKPKTPEPGDKRRPRGIQVDATKPAPQPEKPEENKPKRIGIQGNVWKRNQPGNSESQKSSKGNSEDEKNKNKPLNESENTENTEENISETHSNENPTAAQIKTFFKKERENISQYLATKEPARFSTAPPPETVTNVTVFTLQKKIEFQQELEHAETEKMKKEWDALQSKHAEAQSRMRRDVESNIKFDDESVKKLEHTQSEMQNIYNTMIKSLLERQTQKESHLIFLEKLNCGCDSDAEAESSKQAGVSSDCCLKASPFYQLSKLREDPEDEEVKEKSSSDDLIISEGVSLSTITEEISGTPSDLISISKESSKEQLEEDFNTTYCIKTKEEAKKYCNQSCKQRDVVFVALPCKFQKDQKDEKDEKEIEMPQTPKSILQSAKCKDVSPKSCSQRTDKCPRKSAGYYEPFSFSPQYGSTKTSFTTSDNDSTTDLFQLPQEVKTVRSSTASSVSFTVQEDPNPKIKKCQSKSLPITSRSKTSLAPNLQDEETQKLFYCGQSIPCTPKKIHWQDSTKSSSLTDGSGTGRETFRKESDYDEGEETPSMVVIKNFRPEMLQAKLVPPLPIANISPEHSESEESQPISCSSHFSARTLQTIDKYNLEYSSSLKKDPKYVRLQETKKSRKSSLGAKSQPLSTRKREVKPTIKERQISAPLKRKASSSPRATKVSPRTIKIKSAQLHPFRQKSSGKSPKKSKVKSEAVSPKHHDCHCELYKKSAINKCRIHGKKVQSVPVTHRSSHDDSPSCSKQIVRKSPTSMDITERPKSWSDKSESVDTSPT